MDNEALRQAFKNLTARIIRDVNPDFVVDDLFSKHVIGEDDYHDLSRAPDPTSRCRKLFSLLHLSSHPETFVHLRGALLNEYPAIIAEIDKQRTSLTVPQPEQRRLSQPDGKFLLVTSP